MSFSFRRVPVLLLLAVFGGGSLLLGCDQVTRPEAGQRPSVSALEVMPDSVNASQVPADQVQDSVARVPLRIAATATDPDGTVERVVFTIEPSSNPRGTASGTLQPQQGTRYQRDVALGVPVFQDEVYTIRVFAVDDDSLASNQSIGRFRFEPAP
ncbi:MAG TPA: hypothetical protein VJ884_00595 [Salinibacter sp.]|nr:hypothetical protein [Salinibacter sp.]